MKDYYQILGVTESASKDDIKTAFRKLAFKFHPDTSSESKTKAEERFKEINEAYCVLGDDDKRRQYDSARKGQFAGYGAGSPGFQYSQQDIFNSIFSNQAMFEEMSRMFGQAGLRFDQDLQNHVFGSGSSVIYQFSMGPGGASRRVYRFGGATTDFGGNSASEQLQQNEIETYKPSWTERLLSKMTEKVTKFTLRHVFGLQLEAPPMPAIDQHVDLKISQEEADAGGEKKLTYKRGNKRTKLMVKIPAGIKSGTQIRLKNMGMSKDKKEVDLYVHVKIN